MQQGRRAALASILSVSALSASTAWAHIDLLEPEARAHGTAARGDTEIDVNSNVKSGPCGQVTPGRSSRVATYAPGQVITVRVREENAHVSYLRVSIDLDGENFPLRAQVPMAPETQEQASAAELALGGGGLLAVVRENNDTPGFVHEIEVTLPEQSCTNCTLQVIQFMYDDPSAPYYFQCADLLIAAAAGAQDAGAGGAIGAGGASGAGGVSGTNPPEPRESSPGDATNRAGSAPGAVASSPTPRTAAQGGAASASAPASPSSGNVAAASTDDEGGCSLSQRAVSHSPRSLPLVPLGLLALALGIARRRR